MRAPRMSRSGASCTQRVKYLLENPAAAGRGRGAGAAAVAVAVACPLRGRPVIAVDCGGVEAVEQEETDDGRPSSPFPRCPCPCSCPSLNSGWTPSAVASADSEGRSRASLATFSVAVASSASTEVFLAATTAAASRRSWSFVSRGWIPKKETMPSAGRIISSNCAT